MTYVPVPLLVVAVSVAAALPPYLLLEGSRKPSALAGSIAVILAGSIVSMILATGRSKPGPRPGNRRERLRAPPGATATAPSRIRAPTAGPAQTPFAEDAFTQLLEAGCALQRCHSLFEGIRMVLDALQEHMSLEWAALILPLRAEGPVPAVASSGLELRASPGEGPFGEFGEFSLELGGGDALRRWLEEQDARAFTDTQIRESQGSPALCRLAATADSRLAALTLGSAASGIGVLVLASGAGGLRDPLDPSSVPAQALALLDSFRERVVDPEAPHRDRLTGLFNAQHWTQVYQAECDRQQRNPTRFSVLRLDVSFPEEESVLPSTRMASLRTLGRICRSRLGPLDAACRQGDTFWVLMPEREPLGSVMQASRLKVEMDLSGLAADGTSRVYRVRAGLASYPAPEGDPLSLLEAAEEATTLSSRLGDDRLVVHKGPTLAARMAETR